MLVAEQRSKPLLVLAKTGVMVARAWLPLAAIRGLETGQAATVLVGDQQYAATVRSLGMLTDTGQKQAGYVIEAQFDISPDHVYRAGQAATIRLP
jgi:hypothetical protein